MNRMKKLTYLLSLLLLFPLWLKADPVSVEEAQRIAEKHFAQGGLRSAAPIKLTYTRYPQNLKSDKAAYSQPYYYVFNRGTQEGFVVVSGDDRTAPIVGYSDRGHLDMNKAPEALLWWMQQYDEEYQFLAENPTHKFAHEPAGLRSNDSDVAPLLGDIAWGQGTPYNKEVLNKLPTGCVATAMAQVMFYHRWPKRAQAVTVAYRSEGTSESLTLGKEDYAWDKMKNKYSGASAESTHAVAYLMKEVGASVKMVYTPYVSNAWDYDAFYALKNYFYYRKDAKLMHREAFDTQEWESTIVKDLRNGRPVIYFGLGSLNTGGHAFVCDGYKATSKMYHFNWGWDGSSNGYFRLTKLIPRDAGVGSNGGRYNSGQCIIANLAPDKDGSSVEPQDAEEMMMAVRAVPFRGDPEKTIRFDLRYVQATVAKIDFHWRYQIYKLNEAQEIEKTIATFESEYRTNYARSNGWDSENFKTDKLENGDYLATFDWRPKVSQKYRPFSPLLGNPMKVYFSVKDGAFTNVHYDTTIEPLQFRIVDEVHLYPDQYARVVFEVTNPNQREFYGPVRLIHKTGDKGESILDKDISLREIREEYFVAVPAGESRVIFAYPFYSGSENVYYYAQGAGLPRKRDSIYHYQYSGNYASAPGVRLNEKAIKPIMVNNKTHTVSIANSEWGTIKAYKEERNSYGTIEPLTGNTFANIPEESWLYFRAEPQPGYHLSKLEVKTPVATVDITSVKEWSVGSNIEIIPTFEKGDPIPESIVEPISAPLDVRLVGTVLHIEGAAEGIAVSLYNLSGERVLYTTEHTVSLAHLAKGVYIVRVGGVAYRIML